LIENLETSCIRNIVLGERDLWRKNSGTRWIFVRLTLIEMRLIESLFELILGKFKNEG
jgi:hypothetical protein